MSINLSEMEKFYFLTKQYQDGIQFEIGKRQKLILEEVDRLREVANLHQSKSDPWIKALIQPWLALLEGSLSSIDNMSKMLDFNESFRGLVFMVAGNVNSGKSTLGNFISGRDFLALESISSIHQDEVTFSILNAENHTRSSINHFAEKETECTSHIQVLELNKSLVWVDTPGIASLTKEHGDLAKSYIEGADLVIYVIDSGSAMNREDLNMIKSLGLDQHKPFTILVSKFDERTSGWDDELEIVVPKKIIPKANKERKEQEESILKTLKDVQLDALAQFLNSETLIFFSKYCAIEALKNNDQALWEGSGAPALFKLFNHILMSEATQLKRLTPIRNFNALLRNMINGQSVEDENMSSLSHLISMSEIAIDELKQKRDLFDQGLKLTCEEALNDAQNRAVSLLRASLRDKSERELVETLNQILSNELENKVVPFVREQLTGILTQTNLQVSIDPIELTIDKIEKIYADLPYHTPVKSSKRGLLGTLIGGAIGLLGGPLAATIGSMIGKKISGSSNSQKGRVEKVEVGDNLENVIQSTLSAFIREARGQLEIYFARLHTCTFEEILSNAEDLNCELIQSVQRLEELYILDNEVDSLS